MFKALISYVALISLGTLVFALTNRLSFLDAMYFTTVTLTTVGYGDIHPSNHFAKIFCIIYVFVGFVMITFVLNTISQQVMAATARDMAAARKKKFESLSAPGSAERASSSKNLDDTTSHHMLMATKKIAIVLMPLIFMMVLVAIFEGNMEGWSTIEAFYFVAVTTTTVGYGQETPKQQVSKGLAIFYIPILVVMCSTAVAGVRDVIDRIVEEKKVAQFDLKKVLNTCPSNSNGDISKETFVLYMLKATGKISADDINELLAHFEILDVDNSGTVNASDLALEGPVNAAV